MLRRSHLAVAGTSLPPRRKRFSHSFRPLESGQDPRARRSTRCFDFTCIWQPCSVVTKESECCGSRRRPAEAYLQ